uniref:sensor histidine kinase n=1 Tax=Amycolatopsis viridis TaxID=185678 RepID=UPI0028BD2E96|nr:nitrate- and nitrite sensing domain-containing protein [Amycolatopsis viridis]
MGQLLGQQPKEPSKWAAFTRWRDWRLSAKLAAVSLVPIVVALVLGGITIGNQVERSGNYERMNRLVELGGTVRTLVDALERERTETAALLTQGTVGSSPQLDAARQQVDATTGPVGNAIAHAADADGSVRAPGTAATTAVGRLAEVRRQVAEGRLDAVQALTAYSDMTDALLGLDTAVVAGIGDDAIGGTPSALHDLMVVKEEVSTSQALLGYGIARGNLTPSQLNDLRTAELRVTDRLADFRAAASAAQETQFDHAVVGADFNTRARLVNGVLAAEGASVTSALHGISAPQWTSVSASVLAALTTVSDSLGNELTATATGLADSAGTHAGLLAVLLFLALVLTAAVVILITRHLLRSLRVLRAGAHDIADRQLPAAVRNIQEGREQTTDVQPVPVDSKDEIGEVARAFDAVHSQALRLAVEQANMRAGYSSVFVNLSRRSQSLVQRQLQLIERLERDEEDADQLATLFQLDHLATRMRRNNENLMVLSGAEPGRRSGQPVTTSDVLRAAVSEIEHYQRVVVQPPPDARIVGFAASDLMRLVAELLDNATAFSAPETQVTVTTRVSDAGGLVVDIIDQGIGMNEAEVAEANARLREAGTIDLATSRRMGLFVVGRLAGRHDIGVVLHGGKDIVGVRATVTVPPDLVMDLPAPAPVRQQAPDAAAALPRRRTVNGAGRPEALANFGQSEGGHNGHTGVLPSRPPSDLEISGTALFTPIPAEQGGQPPAPQAAPPAEPEPASDELPSGKALFAANSSPLSEWWSSAANEPKPVTPPPTRRETTPIFDETLSAWFRSDDPPAAKESTGDEPASPKSASSWDFAVDENWRAVQAASQVEPKTFTDAGLPKRRRGEQLLPGSATGEAPAAAPQLPARDPADVRGRLSSFQHGVNRARHVKRDQSTEDSGQATGADQADGTAQGSPVQPAGRSATEPSGAPENGAGTAGSDLPRRKPRPSPDSAVTPQLDSAVTPQRRPAPDGTDDPAPRPTATQAESATPSPQPGSPGAAEPAPAQNDDGTEADTAEADTARTDTAQADTAEAGATRAGTGLPRRETKADKGAPPQSTAGVTASGQPAEPGADGQPAGAADQADGGSAQADRSGTALPQRQSTSGSGLPRRQPGGPAEHGTAGPAQPAGEGTGLFQPVTGEGTGLFQRPEPAQTAPAAQDEGAGTPVPPREPAGAGPQRPASGTGSWSFATDESWAAVQAVSSASASAPSSFTAAGLPKRRRGEQLLPGSALSPGAATPAAPRTRRDPQDVRGRLSSFQQGVQRGRHRTAQSADPDQGTMEGE